jgi:hypothetical protein
MLCPKCLKHFSSEHAIAPEKCHAVTVVVPELTGETTYDGWAHFIKEAGSSVSDFYKYKMGYIE